MIKTRNIKTVVDSEVIACIGVGEREFQIRLLSSSSDRYIRYIVVKTMDVQREYYAVPIHGEVRFNRRRCRLSSNIRYLSTESASQVRNLVVQHINNLGIKDYVSI